MKKLLILAMAVIFTVAMASFALAGDGNGIAGSTHDFSGTYATLTDANGNAEICRICHSPHDHGVAQQWYLNGLLWNHAPSSATYTMYDAAWNPSLDGTVASTPVGIAKLCLACHDGTVAVDTFEDHVGTDNIINFGAEKQIPGFVDGANLDLRGTHPISITYEPFNGTTGDKYLKAVGAPMGITGLTIDDVLDKTVAAYPQGLVNCNSCHDVHNSPNEAVANTPLLRATVDGSAICLACHDK